jgi:hypothetical protein
MPVLRFLARTVSFTGEARLAMNTDKFTEFAIIGLTEY